MRSAKVGGSSSAVMVMSRCQRPVFLAEWKMSVPSCFVLGGCFFFFAAAFGILQKPNFLKDFKVSFKHRPVKI